MIDWLQASVEDRKALYRVLREVMNREGLGWAEIYKRALNEAPVGSGYEDNFRAGRIGRKKARRIADWLGATYPAYAARLDQALGERGQVEVGGAAWTGFLARHGRYDAVSAVLLPEPSLGIVTFARPEPLARPVIPLGAPFCFRFEAAFAGAVLAFQSVGGRWYALPLRED